MTSDVKSASLGNDQLRFAKLLSAIGLVAMVLSWFATDAIGQPTTGDIPLIVRPGLFPSLTEPPCSYCLTQHRKGLVRGEDRVVAWLRGPHNGGAIPLRHFLAATRVINDTYGLFFFDADGGYVTAFKKDYGYEFHGWRRGVMVVRGRDGTLWSALTGHAIEGPQKGGRLTRIPSLVTSWEHWLMLHPESTAYDMFDGKKYRSAELPLKLSDEARESMGRVDRRLPELAPVLGIDVANDALAIPLDAKTERACWSTAVGGQPVVAFWYGPTQSAVAYSATLDDRQLTFEVDRIAPDTAPFRDKETGTRWSLAGRGVDGPLRGKELRWITSVSCRWYAWSSEYPETRLFGEKARDDASSRLDMRGLILDPEQVTERRLTDAAGDGTTTVAIQLPAPTTSSLRQVREAAQRVRASGLALHYWIEVARDPQLASEHPEWLASLQGHNGWRRSFPDFPEPAADEVVKVFPWAPVQVEEAFAAHLRRIRLLLESLPRADAIWLNDLQSAPSACGCGNAQCRWTVDYGPIHTARILPAETAARFVTEVQRLAAGADVIPVWMTECEQHDCHEGGRCSGVPCYDGRCWKEYVRQLVPVADAVPRLGVLALYRELDRDPPDADPPARWVRTAIESFDSELKRQGRASIAASRLLPVLQGWNVSESQLAAQVERAVESGCRGYLIAEAKIDQSWRPVLHRRARP